MNLPDFSKIFHQSSKGRAHSHPLAWADPKEWPEEWTTTYYKAYPRLPKIELGNPIVSSSLPAWEDKGGEAAPIPRPPCQVEGINAALFRIIENRKSRRDFTRAHITKGELSLLLKYSCGETWSLGDGRHRRAQPSGGARFPIEVYPIVFRNGLREVGLPDSPGLASGAEAKFGPSEPVPNLVSFRRNSVWDGIKAGLYHYNIKDHSLDVLWDREFSDQEINNLFSYPWIKDAWGALVMTAVFLENPKQIRRTRLPLYSIRSWPHRAKHLSRFRGPWPQMLRTRRYPRRKSGEID